jgi:L-aminopeptidase/D-esterase-like protein
MDYKMEEASKQVQHMFNSITDVQGIRVGHYSDRENITGCTVVLAPPQGAVAGADIRGTAPATRETDLLRPAHLVERAHAILLTGGSAFGLEAAAGVMRFLEEREIGFETGVARVPIVPAAALFDLSIGNPHVRPGEAAGYAACQAATGGAIEEGSVGAGTGATVGHLLGPKFATKGGIGAASFKIGVGVVVSAMVVVNALGDVVDPQTGMIIAGTRDPNTGEWLDTGNEVKGNLTRIARGFGNTTIGVVATNAQLTKEQANVVAMMAHDGIARAIRPSHSMFDGDALFVLATGFVQEGDVTAIGHAASEVVAAAIVRGVKAATGLGGVPAARDLEKGLFG